MSTWSEQHQSDYYADLTGEAIEHAEGHGFEAHEDYDGYAYVVGTAAAVFSVLSHVEGRVRIEVVGPNSSLSLQELDARQFMGGVHPDAAFLDALEEALVWAKRRLVRGSA